MPKLAAAAVLFSGGRDSSLAACLLAARGTTVDLLTCDNGATIHGGVAAHRVAELRSALGSRLSRWEVRATHALFRRVALREIEQDFARYRVNLIILGSQLATLTEGVLYCLEREIPSLATGFTAYQAHFAEQTPVAIRLMRSFCEHYGVQFLTPAATYESASEVGEALLAHGISTKSLEGFSIFSDTFSEPTEALVESYILEKLPHCHAYAEELMRMRGLLTGSRA
ncbi:hypothetical protein BH23GEM5_BH23GEM5_02300 [soil metagenome]